MCARPSVCVCVCVFECVCIVWRGKCETTRMSSSNHRQKCAAGYKDIGLTPSSEIEPCRHRLTCLSLRVLIVPSSRLSGGVCVCREAARSPSKPCDTLRPTTEVTGNESPRSPPAFGAAASPLLSSSLSTCFLASNDTWPIGMLFCWCCASCFGPIPVDLIAGSTPAAA